MSAIETLELDAPVKPKLALVTVANRKVWSRAKDVARTTKWRVKAHWVKFRPYVGSSAAASCFVGAAFTVALIAGLVVAGIAILAMDYQVKQSG